MENPKFNYQPKVLVSTNAEIRYKGSSGGVITQIIKYLFEISQIKNAISFRFSGAELFVPKLIYSFEEYEHTGSVYHEINIYKFLKKNINHVQSPILITCLPCQVVPIKRLLDKNNIENIIISLVCSNQLEKEATYYFLEKNNIDVNKIIDFRYRGNGWPSGIQIKTDKTDYFFHNNTSKWIDVFHSQIFNLNRCFSCKDTFGLSADLSIADPWLKRYVENDKTGSSIVISHTKKAEELIQKMIADKVLKVIELLTLEDAVLSQKGTLQKKYILMKYKKSLKLLINFFRKEEYKKIFYKISKCHRWIWSSTIGILKRYEGLR